MSKRHVCAHTFEFHTHTHPHPHLCFGDIYKLEHDQELYTLCESIACDKFLKLHAGNNSTTCNSSARIAFFSQCSVKPNQLTLAHELHKTSLIIRTDSYLNDKGISVVTSPSRDFL
jgi:hypothetical protein